MEEIMSPEDHYKIEKILMLKKDVSEYGFFRKTVEMGIFHDQKEFSFSKAMLFSWIKEELDDRKTNIRY